VIAIVVDKLNSGLGIAAKSRGENDPQIQVISALDFRNYSHLLDFLVQHSFSHVIFSWRESFAELHILHSGSSAWNRLRKQSLLAVCFADLNFLVAEKSRVDFVCLKYPDFICATSQEILEKISDSILTSVKVELFRDLPSNHTLSDALRNSERIYDLIWVGNSNWGKNQGIIDHKGFNRIVKPLFERLNELDPKISCISIDLAHGFVPNDLVVQLISQSKFLIQASRSEGTGLPVLEAMAVGTIPISTPVGVAQYLLSDFPQCLVSINPTVNDFLEKIQEISGSGSTRELREKLMSRFFSYSQACLLDTSIFNASIPRNSNSGLPVGFQTRLFYRVKWKVRKIKSALITLRTQGKRHETW